jgi:hypothetical protein
MFKTIVYLLAGLVCCALIAFKPYAKINRTLGLADTVATAGQPGFLNADSLFIEQPVAVVMPQNITDSIASIVGTRERRLSYLKEQNGLLALEEKKIDQRVKARQKAIQAKEQTLLGLDQIEALMEEQKQVNTGGGVSKPRDKIGERGGYDSKEADPVSTTKGGNRP